MRLLALLPLQVNRNPSQQPVTGEMGSWAIRAALAPASPHFRPPKEASTW